MLASVLASAHIMEFEGRDGQLLANGIPFFIKGINWYGTACRVQEGPDPGVRGRRPCLPAAAFLRHTPGAEEHLYRQRRAMARLAWRTGTEHRLDHPPFGLDMHSLDYYFALLQREGFNAVREAPR